MYTLSSGRIQFGAFELDLSTGELRSIEAPDPNHPDLNNKVILREQVFQVLRMLLEREGKIVTREEIKGRLWPNDTVVDFDRSINATITTLRRTLGDSADNPRYIETLARRGYRLMPAIEYRESAPGIAPGETTAPLQSSSLIGKKVSHYRVLDVIGGGGMGMVFKAEDLKLGRLVALKFLPEEFAGDAVALKRFEREAKTASALNHPNICTIYEIEEHEGQPFIAMELLQGDNLRDHLSASKQEPLPLRELLEISAQICDGLQAEHDKGIIHRDIKPANIFLCKSGTVKILDFGLAKLAGDAGLEKEEAASATAGSSADHLKRGLTRTGTTAGTAAYMSPEQVRHEGLDTRTDLFSFGLVLYEMAAGRRAFEGGTVTVIHNAILHQTPVAARDLNSAVPLSLDAIIAKAMEKDREKRYQSAAEMAKDLARVQRQVQRPRLRVREWFAAAALLAVFAAAFLLYWSYRGRVTLSESDTVVLADFDNRTSDPVFDDVLKSALRYGLEQTPYLNLLGSDKVFGTLAELKLPPTTNLTPDIARQVCLRTNSKLVIAGFIADAGVRYRLELRAVDCHSGKEVREREEVAHREQVVHALGVAAAQLRRNLGEPTASLARFNKPLEEARSSSVEALQMGTLGYKRYVAGDVEGAIYYYKRALELDPKLATTYQSLGSAYNALGEQDLAVSAYTRAYELRARMTEPSRLEMENTYYVSVTGEREKALSALWQSVQTFPRNVNARLNLALCLAALGEPDKAADEALEAARLQPTAFTYAELTTRLMNAERLNEAQATMDEAAARRFDYFGLQQGRIRMAFLQNDQRAMQEQWNQAIGRPDAYLFLLVRSEVEEYHGHFSRARQLIRQALGTASGTAAGRRFDTLSWEARSALWEAESDSTHARQIAATALKTASNRQSKLYLALALARAGDTEQAGKMADVLSKDFPLDTMVQNYHLPTIRAAMKLNANDPTGAIAALEPSLRYELSWNDSFNGLYPAYLRGLAYLGQGEGRLAAVEFQKLLDHRGLVGTDVIGATTYLQMARAQKMVGDNAAARKFYEEFLSVWKDADPDLPVYRQAKAEYAQLKKQTQ
jgi:serine/threonine protein kinase/Flp pilus assembly protein TadD